MELNGNEPLQCRGSRWGRRPARHAVSVGRVLRANSGVVVRWQRRYCCGEFMVFAWKKRGEKNETELSNSLGEGNRT